MCAFVQAIFSLGTTPVRRRLRTNSPSGHRSSVCSVLSWMYCIVSLSVCATRAHAHSQRSQFPTVCQHISIHFLSSSMCILLCAHSPTKHTHLITPNLRTFAQHCPPASSRGDSSQLYMYIYATYTHSTLSDTPSHAQQVDAHSTHTHTHTVFMSFVLCECPQRCTPTSDTSKQLQSD